MWIPKSAAEVEEAARQGDLEETHSFDAKLVLPVPAKNHDLAVDVSAMTVDGGSLVYGLGEDNNKRLTVLKPIDLAGAPERVAQIVETSVSEPPFIRVTTLPLENDHSKGYLLVVVPQSARAPHQVTTGDDLRFYGRGAKGNRILSESEVAALYERREQWKTDREQLLAAELGAAPEPVEDLGWVVAFARPVAPDDSLVERVGTTPEQLGKTLVDGATSWGEVQADPHEGPGFEPDLRRAAYLSRRGAAGWTLTTTLDVEEPTDHEYVAKIDLDFDGTGHFFCGRAVDTIDGRRILFEVIIAGNLASFFAGMGALYEAAGYAGHVDVGMAVTGLEGAAPAGSHRWARATLFSGPAPGRTTRVSAAELRDDPKAVTLRLIRRLLDTTRGTSWTPFEEPTEVTK